MHLIAGVNIGMQKKSTRIGKTFYGPAFKVVKLPKTMKTGRLTLILAALILTGCSGRAREHNAALKVQCDSGSASACASYQAAVASCEANLSPLAGEWSKHNCEGTAQ